MFLLLLLHVLLLVDCKWIPSIRCNRIYTEEELNTPDYLKDGKGTSSRCRIDAEDKSRCNKLLHSCSNLELEDYASLSQLPESLNGMKSPLALWYSDISPLHTKAIWEKIYSVMSNKTLTLIGDSTIYQIRIMIELYLHDIGYEILNDVYPNGFSIIRDRFVPHLDNASLPYVLDKVSTSHVTIMNVGVHYGTNSCKLGNEVCTDVRKTLNQIYSQNPLAKIVWMDTLRPHFAGNGDYEVWIKSPNKGLFTGCAALESKKKKKDQYDWSLYEPSHIVAEEYKQAQVAKLYDLTYERYDMHQGVLTWQYNQVRLCALLSTTMFQRSYCKSYRQSHTECPFSGTI